jgi:hypothetical protein
VGTMQSSCRLLLACCPGEGGAGLAWLARGLPVQTLHRRAGILEKDKSNRDDTQLGCISCSPMGG